MGTAASQVSVERCARERLSVLQLPEGHDGLDWLAPIASRVEELAVFGSGCKDLRALEHFTHLQTLTLTERPHATSPPLDQVAATVRDYSGPWFPALDPSPWLRTLMLEQPPRDLASRLSASLKYLRLLSARKLAGVPALACANTVESLEIAGGRALDLTGIANYTGMVFHPHPHTQRLMAHADDVEGWGHPRLRGTMTAVASGSSSVVAVLKPVKPGGTSRLRGTMATTSKPLRHASGRPASHCLKACLERPSTMSSSREGPARSRTGWGHLPAPGPGEGR